MGGVKKKVRLQTMRKGFPCIKKIGRIVEGQRAKQAPG